MAGKNILSDNLRRVRERMAAAAVRAGRDPAQVRLVVVTKQADPAAVRQLVELGELDLGESRVQDLQQRVADVGQFLVRRNEGLQPTVRWHMVGHLQRNKVRPLLPLVHMIHSVDTLRLAETLDQAAARLEQGGPSPLAGPAAAAGGSDRRPNAGAGRRLPVLLEINCSGESQKFGAAVGAAECLVEQIATLPRLELRGLMTMAPRTDDPEQARPVFVRLREVFEDIAGGRRAGPAFADLSMGMSQDFEAAIEEGATLVRIGTAIFAGV